MTSDRTLFWTTLSLALIFLLSLALYLLVPGALTRTVLQFPEEITHHVAPEVRSLPLNWDREHNIELVVREVLLGPARHDHLRLFSREARMKTIFVRNAVVYVDLFKQSFNPDPDVIYSPMVSLDILRHTITNNFTGVSQVVFSVEGEPVAGKIVDKG